MLNLNFKPFPVIETERLILRQISKKDTELLFALRSSAEAMKFIDKPLAQSIYEIKSFIKLINKKVQKNETITWAISLKENINLIGTISFHRVDYANDRAELGYMLMPNYWGMGLISEAIEKVIAYGFNNMNLHSIEANINPNNNVSRKVLEKFNFKKEAYFKENYFYSGQFLDTEVFSLIRTEFV